MGILGDIEELPSKLEAGLEKAFSSIFTSAFAPVIGLEHDIEGVWSKATGWIDTAWNTTSEFVSKGFQVAGDVTTDIYHDGKIILTELWKAGQIAFETVEFLINNPALLVAILAVIGYVAWTIWTTRYVRLLKS